MKVARLYGARDMRIDTTSEPPEPQEGEVLIRMCAVGICGSDLHMYEAGRIGDAHYDGQIILGHEFMGEVIAVGENALDGLHQPLSIGQRVAVDPESPCYQCELCEKGHPNLCPNHTFYGLYPTDGALQERMIVSARNCFPLPDTITNAGGTLLETLGVAIHSVDLGHIRIGDDVAVIGCGPVGLLIIQLLKLAGVNRLFAFDLHDWRVEKAKQLGATHAFTPDDGHFQELVNTHTSGRGVDVAFEVAWADESVQLAAEMARYGGRLVLVGIPNDNRLTLEHATARRKGLTLMVVRRMKHSYPRAIDLTTAGKVQLDTLVTHHFTLDEVDHAFEKNLAYADNIIKGIIDLS
ncbi:MAG: alcohol dehydrogenase catalytic domain-containing protein [Aggregatilineales bacterium]